MQEDILKGKYQGSGRGFGFFIPEGAQSRSEDCFVPPHQGGGAWDGDTVEVVLGPDDPKAPGKRTAQVIRVLERGNPTVTGTIRRLNREVWLKPDNERLPEAIKVMGRVKVRDGEKAAVAMTSYGSPLTAPLGKLCATFGPAGTRAAAVEAILYQQGVEREFPGRRAGGPAGSAEQDHHHHRRRCLQGPGRRRLPGKGRRQLGTGGPHCRRERLCEAGLRPG